MAVTCRVPWVNGYPDFVFGGASLGRGRVPVFLQAHEPGFIAGTLVPGYCGYPGTRHPGTRTIYSAVSAVFGREGGTTRGG